MREKNRHGGENRSGEIRWDFSVNINPLGMPDYCLETPGQLIDLISTINDQRKAETSGEPHEK